MSSPEDFFGINKKLIRSTWTPTHPTFEWNQTGRLCCRRTPLWSIVDEIVSFTQNHFWMSFFL